MCVKGVDITNLVLYCKNNNRCIYITAGYKSLIPVNVQIFTDSLELPNSYEAFSFLCEANQS